jgi:hypothetical protein
MKKQFLNPWLLDIIIPAIIMITLLTLFLASCQKEEAVNISKPDYLSSCLRYKTDSLSVQNDSVAWSIVPAGLQIKHFNAAFNCCITTVNTEYQWNGDTLIITETEVLDQGGCSCNCCYNLTYTLDVEISGIVYVRFIEPYMCNNDNELFFKIDPSNQSGNASQTRSCYPWI